MSVHVISWVLRYSPVEHGERLVLFTLADHASADGTGAYPSVATIGREAKLSRNAVRDALKALEAAGHIVYEGISPHNTKSWRVVMDRGDDYHRANWAAEAEAPGNGHWAVSPSGGNHIPTPRPETDPEPSKGNSETPSQVELDGSPDGSGSVLGPPPPTDAELAGWARAREVLEERANEFRWHTVLAPLELDHVAGHCYVLTAPAHTMTSIRERYLAMITGAVRSAIDRRCTVEIRSGPGDRQNEEAA